MIRFNIIVQIEIKQINHCIAYVQLLICIFFIENIVSGVIHLMNDLQDVLAGDKRKIDALSVPLPVFIVNITVLK